MHRRDVSVLVPPMAAGPTGAVATSCGSAAGRPPCRSSCLAANLLRGGRFGLHVALRPTGSAAFTSWTASAASCSSSRTSSSDMSDGRSSTIMLPSLLPVLSHSWVPDGSLLRDALPLPRGGCDMSFALTVFHWLPAMPHPQRGCSGRCMSEPTALACGLTQVHSLQQYEASNNAAHAA